MTELRVTLLGFVLPDDEFRELVSLDEGMPVQTQRFGLSLVRALQEGGARVSLISSSPATNFPHNQVIRFRTKRTRVRGADGIILGFINLPVTKHLTRAFAVFLRGPKELQRTACEILLVHGVHSPWLAFGAFASHRLGIPCVVVMTDPPNVPHQFDTSLTRVLKKLDQRVVGGLISHLDGVVALARPLAEDFAPRLPYMVMEGIAPEVPEIPQVSHSKSGTPVVLYAGGLSEEYGVLLLLDAHALDPERFRLQIAGRGPLESVVRSRAEREPNLEFLGMVDPRALPELYAAADVLVNPRPPNQGFTRYSFPSKILEYMASGRPVVSTRLEGIPEEYGNALTWASESVEGLQTALAMVVDASPQTRFEAGEAALRCARQKSSVEQGMRIMAFLESITLGRKGGTRRSRERIR